MLRILIPVLATSTCLGCSSFPIGCPLVSTDEDLIASLRRTFPEMTLSDGELQARIDRQRAFLDLGNSRSAAIERVILEGSQAEDVEKAVVHGFSNAVIVERLWGSIRASSNDELITSLRESLPGLTLTDEQLQNLIGPQREALDQGYPRSFAIGAVASGCSTLGESEDKVLSATVCAVLNTVIAERLWCNW